MRTYRASHCNASSDFSLLDFAEVKAQLGDEAPKSTSSPVGDHHHALLLDLIAKELGIEPDDIQASLSICCHGLCCKAGPHAEQQVALD